MQTLSEEYTYRYKGEAQLRRVLESLSKEVDLAATLQPANMPERFFDLRQLVWANRPGFSGIPTPEENLAALHELDAIATEHEVQPFGETTVDFSYQPPYLRNRLLPVRTDSPEEEIQEQKMKDHSRELLGWRVSHILLRDANNPQAVENLRELVRNLPPAMYELTSISAGLYPKEVRVGYDGTTAMRSKAHLHAGGGIIKITGLTSNEANHLSTVLLDYDTQQSKNPVAKLS